MRELKFKFLKRSVPVLPAHKEMIKPKGRRDAHIEAPFIDEISGSGIIIWLGLNTYGTLTMGVKVE